LTYRELTKRYFSRLSLGKPTGVLH